jgi:hypothetical protein
MAGWRHRGKGDGCRRHTGPDCLEKRIGKVADRRTTHICMWELRLSDSATIAHRNGSLKDPDHGATYCVKRFLGPESF